MKNVDLEKIKKNKNIKELLEFGIINIDKPSGPTSFNVSDFVRKTLGLRKTSHFGTLDPKVTGVLPVALNRACKLTGYFLGEDKEYIGIMRIHKDIEMEKIRKVIKEKFLGIIKQTPPVKSRVKRQERQRKIHKFEILEKQNKDILFRIGCEAGTYVRKICDDLGRELGIGAHMLELRRTRAGIFKEEDSVNLYELEKAADEYEKSNEKPLKKIIIPAEIISEIYPAVQIKDDSLRQILTGKPIHNSDLKNLNDKVNMKKDQLVVIFNVEQFIGLYKVINNNDVFAKPEFVMQALS